MKLLTALQHVRSRLKAASFFLTKVRRIHHGVAVMQLPESTCSSQSAVNTCIHVIVVYIVHVRSYHASP